MMMMLVFFLDFVVASLVVVKFLLRPLNPDLLLLSLSLYPTKL